MPAITHSSSCSGVPGNVPGVDRMREDLCDCVHGELRRSNQRIAELDALLLTALALHGGTAFTHSEIEWRAAARKALGIK